MGSGVQRRWRPLFVLVVAVMAVLGWSPSAHAALTWGKSVGDGVNIAALTCPSTAECVALSDGNQSTDRVTFDPARPSVTHSAQVDPNSGAAGLSCPTTTECVEADRDGNAYMFNPQSTAASTSVGLTGTDISCPTATVCASVSGGIEDFPGSIVVFNPEDPGGSRNTETLTAGGVASNVQVACPSATECVGNNGGQFLTFNPQALTAPAFSSSGFVVDEISCPTTTECVAGSDSGDVFSLNPQNIGTPTDLKFKSNRLTALTCRSATDCIALDAAGYSYEGDPHAATQWPSQKPADAPGTAVACPSIHQCLAADAYGHVYVSEASAGKVSVKSVHPTSRGALVRLSCSSAGACDISLSLAAGLSSGPAAKRTVDLKAGHTETVTLTMNSAALRLLRKDKTLGGVLTISEKTSSGETTVTARKLTIRS